VRCWARKARAAGRRRAWALRAPWRVPDAGQRGACAPRWWVGKDSQALRSCLSPGSKHAMASVHWSRPPMTLEVVSQVRDLPTRHRCRQVGLRTSVDRRRHQHRIGGGDDTGAGFVQQQPRLVVEVVPSRPTGQAGLDGGELDRQSPAIPRRPKRWLEQKAGANGAANLLRGGAQCPCIPLGGPSDHRKRAPVRKQRDQLLGHR
jgi:hypothetical protein